MKLMRSILGVLAVSLAAQSVLANNNNSVTATSVTSVQRPKKEGRIWSGFINASRSTSLVDFQDGTRRDNADYILRVNLKLNNRDSVRISGGYGQDLNYPETNDFADSSISFFRAPDLATHLMLGYRAGLILPTSKDSHKRQSLQTSLSAGLIGRINPDRLVRGFSIDGAINVSRNIHQYETALDGRVNTQYNSTQNVSVSYAFKYGLSVSAEVAHRNSWSYQNVMRDSFDLSQELGWQMNSALSLAVGHTNSGASLRPNGNDSNVEVVNENSSLVYGSLTATF